MADPSICISDNVSIDGKSIENADIKYPDIIATNVDVSKLEPHIKGFFVKDEEELSRLGWSRIDRVRPNKQY